MQILACSLAMPVTVVIRAILAKHAQAIATGQLNSGDNQYESRRDSF